MGKPRRMWGVEVWVTGMRLLSGDELMVVAPSEAVKAIEEYALRWEVEEVDRLVGIGVLLGARRR
jgi:hypothetical protein